MPEIHRGSRPALALPRLVAPSATSVAPSATGLADSASSPALLDLVYATEVPPHFAVLSRALDSPGRNGRSPEQVHTVASWLRAVPGLGGLTAAVLDALARIARMRQVDTHRLLQDAHAAAEEAGIIIADGAAVACNADGVAVSMLTPGACLLDFPGLVTLPPGDMVLAMVPSVVITFPRADVRRVLASHSRDMDMAVQGYMGSSVQAFRGWPRVKVVRLAEACRRYVLCPGTVLCAQGQAPEWFGVVVRGALAVIADVQTSATVRIPSYRGQDRGTAVPTVVTRSWSRVVCGHLRPGDVLGGAGLLGVQRAGASVVAAGWAEVLLVDLRAASTLLTSVRGSPSHMRRALASPDAWSVSHILSVYAKLAARRASQARTEAQRAGTAIERRSLRANMPYAVPPMPSQSSAQSVRAWPADTTAQQAAQRMQRAVGDGVFPSGLQWIVDQCGTATVNVTMHNARTLAGSPAKKPSPRAGGGLGQAWPVTTRAWAAPSLAASPLHLPSSPLASPTHGSLGSLLSPTARWAPVSPGVPPVVQVQPQPGRPWGVIVDAASRVALRAVRDSSAGATASHTQAAARRALDQSRLLYHTAASVAPPGSPAGTEAARAAVIVPLHVLARHAGDGSPPCTGQEAALAASDAPASARVRRDAAADLVRQLVADDPAVQSTTSILPPAGPGITLDPQNRALIELPALALVLPVPVPATRRRLRNQWLHSSDSVALLLRLFEQQDSHEAPISSPGSPSTRASALEKERSARSPVRAQQALLAHAERRAYASSGGTLSGGLRSSTSARPAAPEASTGLPPFDYELRHVLSIGSFVQLAPHAMAAAVQLAMSHTQAWAAARVAGINLH